MSSPSLHSNASAANISPAQSKPKNTQNSFLTLLEHSPSSPDTSEPHPLNSTASAMNTPEEAHTEPAGQQQHDPSPSPAHPSQPTTLRDLRQDPRALQSIMEAITVCQPGMPWPAVMGGMRCSACSGAQVHLIAMTEFYNLSADPDYKMQVILVDANSDLLGEQLSRRLGTVPHGDAAGL
ncbi:hypothetical protein LTR56_013535 [Elasticomyces elasticus]|nr:hypothetical protein LTR56_013535 [Elasticomyces elasticus]KAK3649552.1 hypothetical protein LTR22_012909 [Elasticomyces elasticus]KAK4933074.1 hypothetical protein LTR49_000558 [Elasticomyces elasticus]KAK5763973.1 hypothetical protein LTS12_005883 [Elasticomyces elasticus]